VDTRCRWKDRKAQSAASPIVRSQLNVRSDYCINETHVQHFFYMFAALFTTQPQQPNNEDSPSTVEHKLLDRVTNEGGNSRIPTLPLMARVSGWTGPTGRRRLRSADYDVHCASEAHAQSGGQPGLHCAAPRLNGKSRQRLQGGDNTVVPLLSDPPSQIKGFPWRLRWGSSGSGMTTPQGGDDPPHASSSSASRRAFAPTTSISPKTTGKGPT
jgi:hypothetical protein